MTNRMHPYARKSSFDVMFVAGFLFGFVMGACFGYLSVQSNIDTPVIPYPSGRPAAGIEVDSSDVPPRNRSP